MWSLIQILCLLTQHILAIRLVDLPDSDEAYEDDTKTFFSRRSIYHPLNEESSHTKTRYVERRDMGHSLNTEIADPNWQFRQNENTKENNVIKEKIGFLVEQTLHDAEKKIQSVQSLKEVNREVGPYRIGFILSMVKKSRDMLNELFNTAVKHRDSWRALEQLKIFELIAHTNVDTTNLVKQLVEIHISQLNQTANAQPNPKRLLLL